jgi:uncharacterized repeat protein (TIGR03803 family)
VYELVKSGSSYSLDVLASFNGSNGANPFSTLFMDASGNLYGTTEFGGANNDGTVFGFAAVPEPSSWVMTAVGILTVGAVAWRRRRREAP